MATDRPQPFGWNPRLADMADARLDSHGTDDAIGLALGEAAVLLSLAEGAARA